MAVDVTDVPQARPGTAVQLFGEVPLVDELAAHCQTIGYEILTRLGPRFTRITRT